MMNIIGIVLIITICIVGGIVVVGWILPDLIIFFEKLFKRKK